MIFGIGTDIVELARIERAYQRYGDRFAQRVLSAAEWAQLSGSAQPARFLAKRFAAKEAFAKAAGTGLRAPVSLHRISIVHDVLGKPGLQFDGTLQHYLTRRGITAHHLTISDERNLVVAFVMLEGRPPSVGGLA